MCRYVETIKLKDGVFYRLKYHQQRVDDTFENNFPGEEPINVFLSLNETVLPQNGLYKCRIVYDEILQQIEILPYTCREINTLKLIESNIRSSHFKLEDRTEFNNAFALRGECDDVLLVKDGFITDASYTNVAFFDGTSWLTPRIPLLYGTNRAQLIDNKVLIEQDVTPNDLNKFKQVCLFNSMIEFGELILDIKSIVV